MWNGKLKAVTFSYDDGVTQDIKMIELMDKYGLKGTFNLNSEYLGFQSEGGMVFDNFVYRHKVNPEDVKEVYKNHEVAVHTLTHPRLPEIEDEAEIIRQVEQDRLNLEKLSGGEIVGMAYPCGGVNNDDRVAEIIKNSTGVKYSRTITSTYSFDTQNNLYRFNPTVYHIMEEDKLFELGEEFINLTPDKPQIYYIWGHSYEFDIENTWDKFEKFCKMISGRNDIFYGTNKEILLFN